MSGMSAVSGKDINQCHHIFQGYSDTEQPLTSSSEKFVETVGTSVTLLETVMAEVAHLNSAEHSMSQLPLRRVLTSNGLCTLHHQ
jgi:hypothetical protein